MDIIKAITERVSLPQLADTSITQAQKDTLIQAALRAPDHAWLRPSRYLMIEGDARAKLGKIFLDTHPGKMQFSCERAKKVSNMLMRAPLVVVAITQLQEHPKVPRDEQILSTGAGIQNILLAADAMGLGAIWRTGEMAYSEGVRAALKLTEQDVITGFIYLGQANCQPKTLPELDIQDFVQNWE